MQCRLAARIVPFLAVGFSLASCGKDPATPASLNFVDVAASAGLDLVNVCGDPRRWYIIESNGNGAAWLDYDTDGDVDLFIGNGSRVDYIDDGAKLSARHDGHSKLYRNDGKLKFTDVSAATGLDRTDWVNGIAAADADNDGDTDLYLACFGKDVYLRNDSGVFVDATDASGLGNEKWGASAAFGDADNDGDLDLYVANYCEFDLANPPDGGKRENFDGVEVGWGPEAENKRGFNVGAPDVFFENLGNGRFTEATAKFGFALEKALCSYGVIFSDVDADGWQDVLVANDGQPSNLFHNDGKGKFNEEGMGRGFALNAAGLPTAAMGHAVGDFDGDGDFDALRTNFDKEPNGFYVNDGKGHFKDRADACGIVAASIDKLGWDAVCFDAELDGDLDVLVANGHVYPQAKQIGMSDWLQPTQLFENQGRGKSDVPGLLDATARAGAGLSGTHAARGIALGDPDDDGDLDALIVDIDARPRLLENRSARKGHWLMLKLEGTRSNRDGFGARISVTTADNRILVSEARSANGLYSANDPRVHFGLGDVASILKVEVRWPSGTISVLDAPAVDKLHEVKEPAEQNR